MELVLLFLPVELNWCQVSMVASMGPSIVLLVSISQPRHMS